MHYDEQRIDDAVLALLALFAAGDGHTWKGHDFEVMNRLHARGFIGNPVNKNKGVYLTEAGVETGERLAEVLFGKSPAGGS
ncbi:MAG: DUF6429 family protein [Pseudomarimonas sp.]